MFWLASAYPTVFRDASGVWRCLYQGKPRAEPQEPRYPLLLESDDGVRRQAPDLTRAVPLDERRFRNQVMPVTRFREWDCYFDARAEDPRERLKALVTHPSAGTSLWTSADGLRWRELSGYGGAPELPMPPAPRTASASRKSAVRWMPALHTRMSMPPKASSTVPNRASIEAFRDTSAATSRPRHPSFSASRTVRCPSSAATSATATWRNGAPDPARASGNHRVLAVQSAAHARSFATPGQDVWRADAGSIWLISRSLSLASLRKSHST